MTAAVRKAATKKPERLLFRVAEYGGNCVLLPNDGYTAKRLRERAYRVGDILLADLRKPRHPGFHRLAHRLGTLVANNIEEFAGLDGHAVLKRLQVEGNIECEQVQVSTRTVWAQVSAAILAIPGMASIEPALRVVGSMLPTKALVVTLHPRSLSYASMDEAEFKSVIRRICNYIAEAYWPSCTPEEIEDMAEAMPEAA